MTRRPVSVSPVRSLEDIRREREAEIDRIAAREGDHMSRNRRPGNIRTVLSAQGR